MDMTTIGFIGLGIMGSPMAANLVKAGFDVVGYDRGQGAIDKLVQAGGRGATSIAEVVRDADVMITMVPDSPDVEAVVLGEDGVLAYAKPGLLLVDCSSIRPDTSKKVAEAARAHGVGA